MREGGFGPYVIGARVPFDGRGATVIRFTTMTTCSPPHRTQISFRMRSRPSSPARRAASCPARHPRFRMSIPADARQIPQPASVVALSETRRRMDDLLIRRRCPWHSAAHEPRAAARARASSAPAIVGSSGRLGDRLGRKRIGKGARKHRVGRVRSVMRWQVSSSSAAMFGRRQEATGAGPRIHERHRSVPERDAELAAPARRFHTGSAAERPVDPAGLHGVRPRAAVFEHIWPSECERSR